MGNSPICKIRGLLPDLRRVATAVNRRRGHQLAVDIITSSPSPSISSPLLSASLHIEIPKIPKIPKLKTHLPTLNSGSACRLKATAAVNCRRGHDTSSNAVVSTGSLCSSLPLSILSLSALSTPDLQQLRPQRPRYPSFVYLIGRLTTRNHRRRVLRFCYYDRAPLPTVGFPNYSSYRPTATALRPSSPPSPQPTAIAAPSSLIPQRTSNNTRSHTLIKITSSSTSTSFISKWIL